MVFQIGSALLDACVLSALEEEPLYGYALTQKVKSVVDISESTLYPVLRRLTKDGLLSTYDQPFNGRNRRYYVLTDYGKSQLIFLRNEWISYKENAIEQAGQEYDGGTMRPMVENQTGADLTKQRVYELSQYLK